MNRYLAAQVRQGAWNDDPAVLAFLKQKVAAKLEVSNPRFPR